MKIIKHFFILIFVNIFCFCCNGSLFEKDYNLNYSQDKSSDLDCICYEFGFSKLVSITIIAKNSDYEVMIQDGDRIFQSDIKINEYNLLNWVFKNMLAELNNTEYSFIDTYLPYYYKLSYVKNGKEITIESSTMQILNNNALSVKLEKLRTLLVKLWLGTVKDEIKFFKND